MLLAHSRLLTTLPVNPSKYLENVTTEMLERNPVLAEYMKANFPDAYRLPSDSEKSDDNMNNFVTSGSTSKKERVVGDSRNIRKLTCYRRESGKEEGSRVCRYLRANGMIPGVIFGSHPSLGTYTSPKDHLILVKTPWRLIQRERGRYRHAFISHVYDLTVLENLEDDTGGTVHRVVPVDVNPHPIKDAVFCVNYLRYHPARPVKIPVVYINEEESPALKKDGLLLPLQRFIPCIIEEGAPIPEMLEVECANLRFKEVVRTDRVLMPEGVRFTNAVIKKGRDFILGVVHGKSRELIELEESAAAAAAAAASAGTT